MHIQEGAATPPTTCTKMTEEVDRRHAVNGSGGSGADDGPAHSGGRLKFFKDGKFILELMRGCAREGERAGWVSVPRKTFWPPAAPTPTTVHVARNERANSLSVSDDNSSIQSSPWQRDHYWKQSNTRKNISKELSLYYCRPNTLHGDAICRASRAKRRRPFDTTHLLNGVGKHVANGREARTNGDVDETDGRDFDRDKYHYMKLKKPYQHHKLRVYKKCRPARRRDLARALDRLRERAPPQPVNAKLVSCRQEHAMVSPRKRILRELERVSLEESKRRARASPASPASPAPGPSHAPPARRAPSSYTISSLLAEDVPRAPPCPAQYGAPPAWFSYAYLPPAPLYRAPSPLWMPYAAPPAPSWQPHRLLPASDDTANDLPLNLSKH